MFLKVESFYENESLRRPTVPKSYSFGGYAAGGMLSRDNSITSTQSAGARLTKQGVQNNFQKERQKKIKKPNKLEHF